MIGPVADVGRVAGRLAAAAQNALEVARFGGLDTGEEPSPFEVAHTERVYRLRHYFPERRPAGAPLILVPPLMLACEVYDVSPATSAVAQLSSLGVDVWVTDFGAPEHEEGGLERTLADHVLAVSDAVDRVAKTSGGPVHLGGYSQGGMFCYQTAAFRHSEAIASLVTFGSPVDTRAAIPFGLPEEMVLGGLGLLARPLPKGVTVPGWLSRTGFRMLDPAKSLRSRWDFARQLGNRDALMAREGQRRFLEVDGWVAWPGPAMADLLRDFVTQNRMLSGGFVIDGQMVTLADITSPIVCFVGSTDQIGTPRSVRGVRRAAPQADIYEVVNRTGHFGLVVGSAAVRDTWPAVAGWIAWRDGTGPRPERLQPLVEEDEPADPAVGVAGRSAHAARLVTDVGLGVARSAAAATAQGGHLARQAVTNAWEQIPRLNRLDSIGPESRVSIGLLLSEQGRHHPGQTFFLFEDRAHTYRDANRRIDAIVAGLVGTGARQGERVGVLMGTRPSALAVVAALSRLGAVAVMLRPDGPVAREADLGAVTRVVADPEHAEVARKATTAPVFVLGGAGRSRALPAGVTDLEQVDPDAVALPAWYRPDPGRGRDLAFILFTGDGDEVRSSRITNRRWAVSAFGTASAAALSEADTVYSLSPLHHPAGLLTGLGGAIVAGSRLAVASSFDPSTFWTEVRRYGVTVVTYTWTLVGELLAAPPEPGERHHPIRLFLGSGMPANLWRQVTERFAPARVLEFYASTEGEAVLANVSGRKVGSKGRPLPGSATVDLAVYDVVGGRLAVGPDGFAMACGPDEVGLLLARPRDPAASGTVLRGVFARGDSWLATGDLFRRDGEGDYWLVDFAAAVVVSDGRPAYSVPVEDALGNVPAVELAVAYGVESVLVAAVTVRAGRELDAAALTSALAALDPSARPAYVAQRDAIPLTTWYRPRKGPLRAGGIPRPSVDGVTAVWRVDPRTGRYRATARSSSSDHRPTA
jgi:putative long chain acyl-CoA synthase